MLAMFFCLYDEYPVENSVDQSRIQRHFKRYCRRHQERYKDFFNLKREEEKRFSG